MAPVFSYLTFTLNVALVWQKADCKIFGKCCGFYSPLVTPICSIQSIHLGNYEVQNQGFPDCIPDNKIYS